MIYSCLRGGCFVLLLLAGGVAARAQAAFGIYGLLGTSPLGIGLSLGDYQLIPHGGLRVGVGIDGSIKAPFQGVISGDYVASFKTRVRNLDTGDRMSVLASVGYSRYEMSGDAVSFGAGVLLPNGSLDGVYRAISFEYRCSVIPGAGTAQGLRFGMVWGKR